MSETREYNTDNAGDFSHDQCDMIVHMPFLEECAARAGVIVEIGVGHGNGSTRAFARGLARSDHGAKMHIGVDHDPLRPQIRPNKNWWEVHGASEDRSTRRQVEALLGERYADIVFIDTVHTYEQMQMELPVWGRIAGDSTLWIFHDTWMFQVWNHMSEAIKEYAVEGDWEFVDYNQASHGLGLMRHPEGKWSDIEPLPRIVLVPQV